MRLAVVALALTLSACVTPRLHDKVELNAVGQRCGLALGEVFQDEREKKLLFVMRAGITDAQRTCLYQWARKNALKPIVVDQIDFKDH